MTELSNKYNIEEQFEEYTEIDYVYDQMNELEKRINKYHNMVDNVWENIMLNFQLSNDCRMALNLNGSKTRNEFNDIMYDTPFYKQLVISHNNFSRRYNKLCEKEYKETEIKI
jgi:hypothetical protein